MKKSGAGAVLLLALVMITALSVLYWKDVGERLMLVNACGEGAGHPICSVEKGESEVSFFIQVKGENKKVQGILDVLEKMHTKASFFVDGEWMEKYPEDVEKIIENGHDLGSTGISGEQMTELSQRECRKQMIDLRNEVRKQFSYDMFFCSPPCGTYSKRVIQSIYACGYYPVGWSVDSQDWKNYGEKEILRQVIENENLENGAIIRWNTNGKYTAAVLESAVEMLREKGYKIVPVSKLIERKTENIK